MISDYFCIYNFRSFAIGVYVCVCVLFFIFGKPKIWQPVLFPFGFLLCLDLILVVFTKLLIVFS